MERKVGERFKEGNTLLETVKNYVCIGCFYKGNGCEVQDVHGNCRFEDREDEEDVIFKEVKDEEHYYIWGVPNRGEEIRKLLSSKDIITNLDDKTYSNSNNLIYIEKGTTLAINKTNEPSLCSLITSNWTELTLPYHLKDKELVWAWDDEYIAKRCLVFFDSINDGCFSATGKRVGILYDNYEPFNGEYPQWAKEALVNLED